MINKNAKYGDVENVCIVEFGKGTLLVNHTERVEEDNTCSIIIKTSSSPGIPNQYVPEGHPDFVHKDTRPYTTNDFKPEVVLYFHNLEGLEVLQSYINDVRERMK